MVILELSDIIYKKAIRIKSISAYNAQTEPLLKAKM